jgi:isopentenyl diphosphate isomerase/L-lactate dehydrogenase-like FMN-dependent dehydrogenase
LEENLPPDATLGSIDPATVLKNEASNHDKLALDGSPPLDSLLNLDEIEEVATKQISKTAWAYYFSASDDLASKSLNSTAYRSILLRPRIFVDCEKCDTSTTILGHRVSAPIYVSPAAMARLAHPAGEGGIATACASYGAMQIISNNASMTPEQIVATAPASQVFGWQLYVQTDTAKSEAMLARVNALAPRIKFITLTLDAPVPGKREHDQRGSKMGGSLPVASAVAAAPGKLTVAGIGGALFFGTSSKLTWKATLPWLAKNTSLPIVLKGIQTHEDAYLAACYAPQVQGIILSNHGGRALDTAPPPIHTLLEIRKHCPEVLEKIEVYVDGGIKRGTDIAKALCLGARAVGIGRAALWGLGAGGQAGVERTFQSIFRCSDAAAWAFSKDSADGGQFFRMS